MASALQAKKDQGEKHNLGRSLEELLEVISVNKSILGIQEWGD